MNKHDYISDRRLYLDKEGNVVGPDDPNKNSLLVAEGGRLSQEDARKYGLIKDEAEGTDESDLLTEDFPGYVPLSEAGYTKRSELASLPDDELTAIRGIGPATAEKIRSALKGE